MPLNSTPGHSHEVANLAIAQFQNAKQNQNALFLLWQGGKRIGNKLIVEVQITAVGRKYKFFARIMVYTRELPQFFQRKNAECRMAKIEDCPGFETFGADVKAARKAKQLSRSALADMIHCDSRYLANIENEGTLPSLPVVIQLIKICGLPVERYFNPELMREESAERQRVSHKLQLCPEEYLPIVEGAIDGALRIHEQEKVPACV